MCFYFTFINLLVAEGAALVVVHPQLDLVASESQGEVGHVTRVNAVVGHNVGV